MSIPATDELGLGVLQGLIERFGNNLATYKAGGYKEASVRTDYLNPFFEVLGWDVRNEGGKLELYRDVVVEDSVEIEGHQKAPDYAFRIGGVRKFFVEAKKPSVDILGGIAASLQVRRYSYSAKLPLGILTDFEEFAVYDTRVKPDKGDKASTARIFYCTFRDWFTPYKAASGVEYTTHFDFIRSIFAKDAIERGSFEQWLDKAGKRGTSEVDREFLGLISGWREELARNLAARNLSLEPRDLNLAVQRLIDRLVFLRFAEDRGAEVEGTLKNAVTGKECYRGLSEVFEAARRTYNSDLFEKNALIEGLAIDDKTLRDIIGGMYPPECPYEFSVMPLEILGSAYEQFLGQTIRVEGGEKRHRAIIEEKPEVRKAGGVYYTPQYIVDYIVKETVGAKLAGMTVEQASTLRIVDPACGSGSFLIGAFTCLLTWHLEQYTKDDASIKKAQKAGAIFERVTGSWRLTLKEKRRILVNSIHGVDIDAQAVEVTKLSLFLKLLEDEGMSGGQGKLALAHESVLPRLDGNIKCGNSLIGPDYYDDKDLGLFPDEDLARINVFDWQKSFPAVFKAGGFDCVVGNPPYIRIQALSEWAPAEVEAYKKLYRAASEGNYDIYVVFVEKGLALLNPNGRLGFILPHKFFNAKYGRSVREVISSGNHLSQVVHFGDQQVFDGATTYTCLLFLSQQTQLQFHFNQVKSIPAWIKDPNTSRIMIGISASADNSWSFSSNEAGGLLQRLAHSNPNLESITDRIFQGLKTSHDKIFILEVRATDINTTTVYSRHTGIEFALENTLLHPLMKGGDSRRYSLNRHTGLAILFPYESFNGKATLLPASELADKYPATYAYLLECKTDLESRENGKMKGPMWYAYGRNQALEVISLPKIFTPDIAPEASYSYDDCGDMFFTGGAAGGYGILVKDGISRHYILGLLNSRLLDWCNKQVATQMRGGWYSFESRYIRNLPIALPKRKKDEVFVHKIEDNVKEMNVLHVSLQGTQAENSRKHLSGRAEILSRQIDQCVYKLYDLTDEEIAIVEGG